MEILLLFALLAAAILAILGYVYNAPKLNSIGLFLLCVAVTLVIAGVHLKV